MNSRYWGKTIIKLLNLINSVYIFSNNGSETENSSIKTSTLVREHVSTQVTLAREHVSTQGTLELEYVNTQGMLAREHVGTQYTLACEHVKHARPLAREPVSNQGTLAREHTFSTQDTQFSRLVIKGRWKYLKKAFSYHR